VLGRQVRGLSTGKKINSAADDAAGFAIAESMTAQVRGLSMGAKNASDALGLLKVVENATNDVTDMLQRVRELAVQAQSGTNSSGDIANLQLEAEALMTEITRVSSDTTYNNKAYLGEHEGTISIQVGYNDGDTIDITTYNIDAESLGVAVAAADNGDDSDVATADLFDDNTNFINIEKSGALAVISNAIDQVAGYKAEWGAGQN
jgi:flagellin